MSDKTYQDNHLETYARPPCAQLSYNSTSQQYVSYTVPVMTNNSYNMCDFMYGPQTIHRNQNTYTPTSFFNYSDQLDATNWVPDPRVVADIERGLKFSDKIETIEITSKDLSPASCCSNIDLLIPDFYKTLGKDTSSCNKPVTNDGQWYCNASCGNQKYGEYTSCSQINVDNNLVSADDKARRDCNVQKTNEFYGGSTKAYAYNPPYMQQLDKSVANKGFENNGALPDCNSYNHYQNKISEIPLLNIADINPEQFYSQNSSCIVPLAFEDINIVQQSTPAGSNEESDIVVEESEEEITDYGEDLERRYDYSTNCVVCNTLYTPIGSQFYILTADTPLTMSSQKPVFTKLIEMVGTIRSKRTYLCSQCLGLINTIDHLHLKLESSKVEFFTKYERTCKEKNSDFRAPKASRLKNPKKFKNFCGLHSFKCKICKQLFNIKKIYEAHHLKHKTTNRFLCELCGQRFSRVASLKLHVNQHNRSPKKLKQTIKAFLCKICGKPFRTRTNLKEHENSCSGELPFKCKHGNCDKKFATSTKLKNHVKLKHDKKFVAICSICNIGFVKVSPYKSHMISHSTEKNFNCTKCDKSYKTLSNLKHHMKYHNEKLPFNCHICKRGFMRKEYLESHVNKHDGVKNYACQFCDKKLISQKNLDAHLKYHDSNVKKKNCNICGKSVKTSLEEHIRTHNNLREFECAICKMTFNTKSALAKHKKRKHISNNNVLAEAPDEIC